MSLKPILLGLLAVVLIGLGIAFLNGTSRYNQLVVLDEDVKSRWGYVESAYQRRADVIPNLVRVVEASGKFEKSTLEAVIQARASATQVRLSVADLSDGAKIQSFDQAQGTLGMSLSRLLVSMEQYPDLKTSTQFRDLMVELEGTENRIHTERNLYNEAVKGYNQSVRAVPNNIVALFVGMKPKEPFKTVTEGADLAPTVQFGN